MSSLVEIIAVRKSKHLLLNNGTYPLSSNMRTNLVASLLEIMEDKNNPVPTTISLEDLQQKIHFCLRGRLSAIRKSGSITFVNLTDETGHIQLVATKHNLPDYDKLKLLDLGDIVEVVGEPVLTKTGERSLLLSAWKVLTKSHRPPPEKFVGIADPELKYRKRYLDLMSSEESRARFLVRSEVLRTIRNFMESERFHEVETSTLNAIASGANAKPFITHHNALDADLRLRIAPELYLKRLLVGGFDRVFEIGRAYRNEGIDTRHNPEFTIMESYEAYGNFPRLLQFTQDLLHTVDALLPARLSGPTLQHYKKWKAERTFTLKEFRQVAMHEAVMTACTNAGLSLTIGGCELMCGGCVSDEVFSVNVEHPDNQRLLKIDIDDLRHALSEATSPGEQWFLMFEHVAEPFLTEDYRTADGRFSVPVFITRYPKSVCPLARANDFRKNECDRFELFIEGRELANAFQELNDPEEQATRFREQLETNHKDPMDFDADYIEALEMGMPPCIGFGMGLERLCMLLTNTTSIKDVILFPTLKPIKSEYVRDPISQT